MPRSGKNRWTVSVVTIGADGTIDLTTTGTFFDYARAADVAYRLQVAADANNDGLDRAVHITRMSPPTITAMLDAS